MNRIGNEFSMCNNITSEFISDYLPRFIPMCLQKPFKESPCCLAITTFLKIHIDNLSILINCSPEVMLFTVNLDEHFIDEKCIAIATMFPL